MDKSPAVNTNNQLSVSTSTIVTVPRCVRKQSAVRAVHALLACGCGIPTDLFALLRFRFCFVVYYRQQHRHHDVDRAHALVCGYTHCCCGIMANIFAVLGFF